MAPRSSGVDVSSCEIALQALAQDCQADLQRAIRSAADGNPESLHKVRIALTRFLTAIRFFAPAVDRSNWRSLQKQARWLNRQAGYARDVDVALKHGKGATRRLKNSWLKERERRYRELRNAVRSTRYSRFMRKLKEQYSRPQIGSGEHHSSFEAFSLSQLGHWQRRLLRDRKRLERLSDRRRHRLRKRAKRFKYALSWSLSLMTSRRSVMRAQIALAQRIQDALGDMNDAATHLAQARTLDVAPLPQAKRLDRPKRRHHLLRSVRTSLDKLRWLRLK